MNTKHEYPKWMHHASKPARIVLSAEAKDALGSAWAESPAAHGVVTHPAVDQAPPPKPKRGRPRKIEVRP